MRSLASQKRTPRKTSFALGIITILAVAAIGVGGTFVWFKLNGKQVNSNNSPSDTAGNNGTSKQDLPSQTPADQQTVPIQKDIQVAITNLEQKSGMVTIAGAITGATDGKCVATFKSAGQINPIYGQAKLAGDPATCTISLDEVQFSYLGEWTVTLTYYPTDNTSQAESQPKTITIH